MTEPHVNPSQADEIRRRARLIAEANRRHRAKEARQDVRLAALVLAGWVALLVLVAFVYVSPTRAPRPRPSCELADYHDGRWYNHAGTVVGLAPVEDAPITYVGDCR